MNHWWLSLTALERIYACIAIPATLLMVIQLVVSLLGLGGILSFKSSTSW